MKPSDVHHSRWTWRPMAA